MRSKPLRPTTARRAREANVAKRLQLRQKWDEEMRGGSLGAEQIRWAGEALFCDDASIGRAQNLAIRVENPSKKSDLPNDLIIREGGNFRGGASVMIPFGLPFRGKGASRFALPKTKINAAVYLETIENARLSDRHQMCGAPPDCVFQRGGRFPRAAGPRLPQGTLCRVLGARPHGP